MASTAGSTASDVDSDGDGAWRSETPDDNERGQLRRPLFWLVSWLAPPVLAVLVVLNAISYLNRPCVISIFHTARPSATGMSSVDPVVLPAYDYLLASVNLQGSLLQTLLPLIFPPSAQDNSTFGQNDSMFRGTAYHRDLSAEYVLELLVEISAEPFYGVGGALEWRARQLPSQDADRLRAALPEFELLVYRIHHHIHQANIAWGDAWGDLVTIWLWLSSQGMSDAIHLLREVRPQNEATTLRAEWTETFLPRLPGHLLPCSRPWLSIPGLRTLAADFDISVPERAVPPFLRDFSTSNRIHLQPTPFWHHGGKRCSFEGWLDWGIDTIDIIDYNDSHNDRDRLPFNDTTAWPNRSWDRLMRTLPHTTVHSLVTSFERQVEDHWQQAPRPTAARGRKVEYAQRPDEGPFGDKYVKKEVALEAFVRHLVAAQVAISWTVRAAEREGLLNVTRVPAKYDGYVSETQASLVAEYLEMLSTALERDIAPLLDRAVRAMVASRRSCQLAGVAHSDFGRLVAGHGWIWGRYTADGDDYSRGGAAGTQSVRLFRGVLPSPRAMAEGMARLVDEFLELNGHIRHLSRRYSRHEFAILKLEDNFE